MRERPDRLNHSGHSREDRLRSTTAGRYRESRSGNRRHSWQLDSTGHTWRCNCSRSGMSMLASTYSSRLNRSVNRRCRMKLTPHKHCPRENIRLGIRHLRSDNRHPASRRGRHSCRSEQRCNSLWNHHRSFRPGRRECKRRNRHLRHNRMRH